MGHTSGRSGDRWQPSRFLWPGSHLIPRASLLPTDRPSFRRFLEDSHICASEAEVESCMAQSFDAVVAPGGQDAGLSLTDFVNVIPRLGKWLYPSETGTCAAWPLNHPRQHFHMV